jgi:predicted HTH domain antitoxin
MKTVSIRLKEKTLKKTSRLASIEKLDTSTTLRQSIEYGLDILGKKYAVEMYAKRAFSLSQAAKFAGISVGEMMDLLVKSGVKANYSMEDAKESFDNIGKLSK